jgi:hypothetical protein
VIAGAPSIPDDEVPAFLRPSKPLRPLCLRPDECAGVGRQALLSVQESRWGYRGSSMTFRVTSSQGADTGAPPLAGLASGAASAAAGLSIAVGSIFEVDCPFIRSRFDSYDEDGPYRVLSWKPGIEWIITGMDEADMRAHGMGKGRYTVIAVAHLPRPYPTRVFFTRKWTCPDGRVFGNSKLHVMTREAFKRRTVAYRPAGSDRHTGLIVRDMDAAEREKALSA